MLISRLNMAPSQGIHLFNSRASTVVGLGSFQGSINNQSVSQTTQIIISLDWLVVWGTHYTSRSEYAELIRLVVCISIPLYNGMDQAVTGTTRPIYEPITIFVIAKALLI